MITPYRGRIAPSPTGFLHVGHGRTFWVAYQRALVAKGALVLRNEDLDASRCRPEFARAMLKDLAWLGIAWQEGPDRGGPYGPYSQSERGALYRHAWAQLRRSGVIYPCTCSRQDVLRAVQAPHLGEDEPVYPGTCRPPAQGAGPIPSPTGKVNWRFRVPDGQGVQFIDGRCGQQSFTAGRDFGDFVVWRHDDTPSYQLAVVVDDAAMGVTEVVRGADLLLSTARQLLLYAALGYASPRFYHCPLMTDAAGVRLAKRHDVLSLRALRAQGIKPEELWAEWSTILEQAFERGAGSSQSS